MAQEYQPRRFFRNAPNRLLQRYFAARNVLTEVDFGALNETQVEPIYEAWIKLGCRSGKRWKQVQSGLSLKFETKSDAPRKLLAFMLASSASFINSSKQYQRDNGVI